MIDTFNPILRNRILELPWWEKEDDLSKKEYYKIWEKLNFIDVDWRIKNYPINKEIITDFLLYHTWKIELSTGYFLFPSRISTCSLYINKEEKSQEELEKGVAHEIIHFVYRIKGGHIEESDKHIEDLIEQEAQRFVKENQGYVTKMLKNIWGLEFKR